MVVQDWGGLILIFCSGVNGSARLDLYGIILQCCFGLARVVSSLTSGSGITIGHGDDNLGD